MFPLFIYPVSPHQKKVTVFAAFVLFLYSMGREGESLDISNISIKHALCRHKVEGPASSCAEILVTLSQSFCSISQLLLIDLNDCLFIQSCKIEIRSHLCNTIVLVRES